MKLNKEQISKVVSMCKPLGDVMKRTCTYAEGWGLMVFMKFLMERTASASEMEIGEDDFAEEALKWLEELDVPEHLFSAGDWESWSQISGKS